MSEQVLEKLDKMDEKLDELVKWKAVHQESHKTIDRDVTEVREVLFENPDLKSQVQTLMNCKRGISRWRDFWMGVLKTVVAVAIIAILTWFLFLYKVGSP